MALLQITTTSIDGVLKNVYEKFRVQAFPLLTPLLANMKKAAPGGPERMTWGGNGVFWDVVLTRPVGMVGSQSGFFPPSAEATEKQANVGIKRTYVRRQIDALAIAGTKDSVAAYVPLARKIVQEAMDAAKLGQQEVLHGDGRGIKALIDTVNSTTEIVVSSPYGLAGSGRAGLLLDVGMYIAVLDTGSADAVLGRATITAITHSGDQATLTLDTAIASMAATDKIVAATTSDTSFNQVPNGLQNLLNRGNAYQNLHNITSATYSRWDAIRMVAGTDTPDVATPSEFDIWDLCTRVANKSGKDPKTKPGEFLLLTTPGLEKKIAQTFFGQRQWTMQDRVKLKGGFSALSIMGLPLISDFWCPAGTIYLVHLPSLSWVDRQDWVKLRYEDSGAYRFIADRDAYEFTLGSYWNTCVLQRNAHGMITGYTDTVRYDHV